MGQVVLGLKGTRVNIDTSKWRLSGNNISNKNSGNVGIGTNNPTAKFHLNGSIRLENLHTNLEQTRVLTSDSAGNLYNRQFSNLLSGQLSGLTTGILKITEGSGILSTSTASDFPILNQNTTGNAATVTTNANLIGPVQSIGNTTSIASNVITNINLVQIPTQTIKGRSSISTGPVEDLTPSQVTAMLSTFNSTSKGLVPPSGGGTKNFLRADGIFAELITGYRQMVVLASDVVNNSSSANTLIDVTGLSFDVVAGVTYRFFAIIPYSSTSTNNGTRWTISTPTTTSLSYVSRYTLSTNNETVNYLDAPNLPVSCNNNSILSGNIATIQGVITPSANGKLQIRFARETAGSQITAKAGASLEWW
jgi:hypothetical protein